MGMASGSVVSGSQHLKANVTKVLDLYYSTQYVLWPGEPQDSAGLLLYR